MKSSVIIGHWSFFVVVVVSFLQPCCPNGISPMGNLGCFPQGKPAVTEFHDPTYGACGCFSVSIIHQTPSWSRGSLTCTLMLMRAIAYGGVQTHVRESALKVDSGRIFLAAPGTQTCISGLTV